MTGRATAKRFWPAAAIGALALAGLPAAAQQPQQVTTIDIPYLALHVAHAAPESALAQPAEDIGVQGARLAIADNQGTGKFLNQDFKLDEAVEPDDAAVIDAFKHFVADGRRFVVTDLPAALLLKLADMPEGKGVTFLDATSTDDSLRAEDCRKGMLHLLPSRAMRADALMQYLSAKGWRRVLLAVGRSDPDKLYADAIRRSAKKFQITLADDKIWTNQSGMQRTDTGHLDIASEVARFTQGVSYDVVVVADETNHFGNQLSYRGTDPRPVMGTQGMWAASWGPSFEQWGATQLQNRFRDQAKRVMTERDFGGWEAVRAVGEAATRGGSADPAAIADYLHNEKFEMAAYKGARLTFRPWDGQLRQPVLLLDDHTLVSVSPQPGFLHQFSELDTLGVDQPETTCHFQ